MKRAVVGTRLGRMAMTARSVLGIVRAAYSSPESVGTLANDHLACSLVTKLCTPGKTFVDVGAHIGSIIDQVRNHDRTVRVVAIEAVPDKVAHLKRRFPTVDVHGCAASDSEGHASFFVHTRRSAYSTLQRPSAAVADDAIEEIRVPTRALDQIVADADVDVVKIDVEGAELHVLRGAAGLLARCRPLVMFESAPVEHLKPGDGTAPMWQWLAERQYTIVVPNRLAHDGPGLGLEGFADSHIYPRRTTNYFAVPMERREEIRDRARRVLGIAAP